MLKPRHPHLNRFLYLFPRRAARAGGFSLIEAAIVLGIVGLVIGGIWVAAATVSENQKTVRITEAIITGTTKLQRLLKPSDESPDVNGYTDMQNVCIKAKIFPADFYRGNTIRTPFGITVPALFGVVDEITCQLHNGRILFSFWVPNKKTCLKMTSMITAHFRNHTDLIALAVVGGDNSPGPGGYTGHTTFPLTPAGNQCDVTAPTHIRMFLNFVNR